jgi:hypothetical protein
MQTAALLHVFEFPSARCPEAIQGRIAHFDRCVYGQGAFDFSFIEKAGEGRPALEHVVHRLCDVAVPRQPGAFGEHPPFELADDRQTAHAESALQSLLWHA